MERTTDFPALTGGTVTERHARECREYGHARHTVAGEDTGTCPRCGETTIPAALDPALKVYPDTEDGMEYGFTVYSAPGWGAYV